jgi:hypothetical protein
MAIHVARIPVFVLLCIALAVTSCVHVGQRLLHIEVELDGKVAFEGIRGVPDNTPVEQMWDVLNGVPFEMTADYADSLSDPDEQTRTLNGNVVVRIRHVDHELAVASLSSLALERGGSDSSWFLSDGEANRVKQASAK